MVNYNKILSILLIPLMMLSFAEVKLHFHLCSESGTVSTDLHLVNKKHDADCACEPVKPMDNSCCQDECSGDIKPSAHSCCVDIEKYVKTDEIYKVASQELSFDSAIMELPTSSFQLVDLDNLFLAQTILSSDLQPPNAYSQFTVLRL